MRRSCKVVLFERRHGAVSFWSPALLLVVLTCSSVGSALPLPAQSPPITACPLEYDPANGAIQGTVLVTSFPITNTGKVPVNAIRVTSLTITIGSKTTHGTVVGGTTSIGPEGRGASFGSFPSSVLTPGAPTLTIAGSCNVSGANFSFNLTSALTVAPKSPGSAAASSGTATVTHNPNPGLPLVPKNTDEANESVPGWVVPIGPVHPLTHSPAVAIAPAPPVAVDPPGLQVYGQLTPMVGAQNGIPVEPSGATAVSGTAAGVVVVSSNPGDGFSITGGASWQPLNSVVAPSDTLTPCCDQIVHYIPPPIDRFVWLIQFWGPKGCCSDVGPNLERIAVASPASIVANVATPEKAWAFFDITPAEMGLGNDFFDFPDLSVGANNLFVSFDDVGKGLVVVRIPLNLIQVVGQLGEIPFQFTNPSDSSVAYGGHLTQNPGASIFWAGHNSNSSMRVFSWPDGSNVYSWQSIDIGSWPNDESRMVALTPTPPPTRQNWLSKLQGWPTFQISGSTLANSPAGVGGPPQLYFAWTASAGDAFSFPQVEWVTMGINPIILATQRQLQSPNTAIAYPALTTNSQGEVGISAEMGGGATFENHAIGFLIDNQLFTTTNSNFGVNRFGDYVTIRQDQAHPERFDAFGYGEDNTGGIAGMGTEPVVFTIFGRPPAPTYDEFTISIGTGDDNAESKSEILATLSGQKTICAKQSDSVPANSACPGNGNSSPTWDNFTLWNPGTPFPLTNPQPGVSGFSTLTISLVQQDPNCTSMCDNWDLQSINVVAIDSTGVLPPITLVDMSQPNTGTNNCIARLKGADNGNATAVLFGDLGTGSPTHVYANGKFKGETTTCINNGG